MGRGRKGDSPMTGNLNHPLARYQGKVEVKCGN